MSDKNFEEMERKANEYFAELERREKELEDAYNSGVESGIKQMKDKMLLACANGTPIEIDERAYFIKSDMQNLHDIFANLETNTE